jgi:fatty acid desaturase
MVESTSVSSRQAAGIEYPTLLLLGATYAGWAAVTVWAPVLTPWLAVPLTALLLAQHSSIQHEVLHGHPFRPQWLADLTVFPAIGILIPYERFRDLHLAHHYDPLLTDPYDDPESNFVDPAVWDRLPGPVRALRSVNNTLAGRMLVGPALSCWALYRDDLRDALRGNRRVIWAYVHHALGLVPVVLWLGHVAAMPVWAYLLACYLGLSLLKVRTFLEHRAHERAGGRSVVIEDRGLFALLFLNNNFHAVHHAHPAIAWYRLPGEFARRREEFLKRNGGYYYRSYAEVFARHFLRRKDPVAHPMYPLPGEKPAVHPVSGRATHR